MSLISDAYEDGLIVVTAVDLLNARTQSSNCLDSDAVVLECRPVR